MEGAAAAAVAASSSSAKATIEAMGTQPPVDLPGCSLQVSSEAIDDWALGASVPRFVLQMKEHEQISIKEDLRLKLETHFEDFVIQNLLPQLWHRDLEADAKSALTARAFALSPRPWVPLVGRMVHIHNAIPCDLAWVVRFGTNVFSYVMEATWEKAFMHSVKTIPELQGTMSSLDAGLMLGLTRDLSIYKNFKAIQSLRRDVDAFHHPISVSWDVQERDSEVEG